MRKLVFLCRAATERNRRREEGVECPEAAIDHKMFERWLTCSSFFAPFPASTIRPLPLSDSKSSNIPLALCPLTTKLNIKRDMFCTERSERIEWVSLEWM